MDSSRIESLLRAIEEQNREQAIVIAVIKAQKREQGRLMVAIKEQKQERASQIETPRRTYIQEVETLKAEIKEINGKS